MGDRDRLAIDTRLSSFDHSADLYHPQLHSLERYIRRTIISEHAQYRFIEIVVEFIKRRPTSDFELVFKDDAGVEHKSGKFKEDVPVHWNIDSFVYICCIIILRN